MENMLYSQVMTKFLNFLKLTNSLKNIYNTWKMLQCLMQNKSFSIISNNSIVNQWKYMEQLMEKLCSLTSHF
jgi:hypothetical protein